MKEVGGAMSKCPATYEVRGGPSPILGTYNVSSREFESGGWKGYVQQIAHTNPADDVYYEDTAHVVVQRANVILYLDVTHQQDHRGAFGLVRQGRGRPAHGDQAPRMRALARGLLAALLVLAGAAGGGGRARDDRAHDAGRRRGAWRRQPREVTMRWSEPVDLGPGSRAAARRDRQARSRPEAARTSAAIARPRSLALPSRAGERHLRRRLAGHLRRLASGLGRVLVHDRRSRARWSPPARRARRARS